MKYNTLRTFLILVFSLVLFNTGCVSHKKMVSFQMAGGRTNANYQKIQQHFSIRIQPDDILGITVHSIDASAASPFNYSGPQINNKDSGYLVDAEGYVQFPVLGKMRLQGMTRAEAKEFIQKKLLTYLKDAVVEVRFLNLHVSILGEVTSPGIYTFEDEKFTLLEALAKAGGISQYGNQMRIQVIRENGNAREFGLVDLTSAEIFNSPYYFMMQNDIIYIEPMKAKASSVSNAPFYLSFVTAVASLAAVMIQVLRN